jgi:hypothetical protein
MGVEDDKLQALYRELRAVEFDPVQKPCAWENLTDVLEILAVSKGIKPSHLNGCGLQSPRLLTALEWVAAEHGLRTLRTRPPRPPHHQEPRVPRAFLEWQQACERHAASVAGEVLWLYHDPSLITSTQLLLDGRENETEVLGYPACCVRARREIGVRLNEALVEGYRRQYGAVTVPDLIRCAEQDLAVALPLSLGTADHESRRLFPFVQFTACAQCLRRAESPAARINAAMQNLARELDEGFARAIGEAAQQLTLAWCRPACPHGNQSGRQDSTTRNPGRNDRCPCGSGRKYKRCCARRV